MMDSPIEKVYVNVGNDKQEGLGTLEWALRNWSSQPISIVILHVVNTCRNFVHTPFGKLPASAVNDEKLEVLRMCEQEETDKLLGKYMAFCGKVKSEILKIENPEEPIHKVMVALISKLRITKLVMGMTFMKSSPGRSKSAISGSFYVHKHKPDFCELFIICGGKLVFLRDEKEGYIEDDQGAMVAKMREKGSLRGWFGKILTDNPTNYAAQNPKRSPTNHTEPTESQDPWAKHAQEIENYLEFLSKSNNEDPEQESDGLTVSPKLKWTDSDNMSVSEKIETMKAKIEETHKKIEERKMEAKASVYRQSRAEWIISLCNQRAQELEACVNEEIAKQIDIRRELDTVREQLYDVSSDVKESKSRLNSILELQTDLANKLRLSSSAKSHAEAELQKAVTAREETVKEIEELRRQKDVLQQRLEFCRERDAIARASTLNFNYTEFTADEIREGTDNFSEGMKLKSGGDEGSNTFKGRINHTTIAVKMQTSLSQEEFQAKMELLCQIRHPHLITMIGACGEPKCIVYEYMHNGSLQEMLFSSSHRACRRSSKALQWQVRMRIAAEIFSGLGFLHSLKPRPIVHGNLEPGNVLLDRNLVAKLTNFRISRCVDESEVDADICSFGVLMLQLLTGRESVEGVRGALEGTALIRVVDEMAGEWPLDMAEEFARVAIRCMDGTEKRGTDQRFYGSVLRQLREMARKAGEVAVVKGGDVASNGFVEREDEVYNAPRSFFCPILQEIMNDPHVAADGFSYELKAIEEWLATGNQRSPMTNLKLKYTVLTPNHILRSLINDWRNRSSAGAGIRVCPCNTVK